MSRTWVVVCLVALCHCRAATDTSSSSTNSSNVTEPFVPTDEWQEVKKGQAVPEGLHVRMNFATKIVEAKLLDDKDGAKSKSQSLQVVQNEDDRDDKREKGESEGARRFATITVETEEALKAIKGGEGQFRTLEELETELKDLNMNVKTDAEIMSDLFARYKSLSSQFLASSRSKKDKLDQNNEISGDSPVSIDLLDIFADFEYLVHQYDNAQEFIRLKGLETVVYPNLNGTESALKSEALKVLAACLQNNIKVQIYALETNAGELLLKILSLDNNEYVKTRAIRAFGSLVRGFPTAQKQLISKHGLDVLQNILLSKNPSFFKLKFQILTLLEDLVVENRLNFDRSDDENKIRTYREVDLTNKLSNPVFCGIISKMLQEYFDSQHSFAKVDELEHIHQIVSTMMSFSDACKMHHYKDKKMLTTFHRIQTAFEKTMSKRRQQRVEESTEDDPFEIDESYARILEVIENYIDILHESKVNDEL